MQRIGYLYEQVYSFENLLLAYRKARKGSSKSKEAHHFFFNVENELLNLAQELKEKSYQPSPYRYFVLEDPKRRLISVATFKDRVVHHAIVNILEPIYEKIFIHDSYATRKGKGVHAAITQAQSFLKSNRWFLKADVEKFFDSIDHQILLAILARKIKDKKLLHLINKIISNGGKNGKGLPIGNLTSQFFANVYLNPFDYFVKETLKIKSYLRYMDDFVIFSPEKTVLLSHKKAIVDFLAISLQLSLKENATFINQQSNGLSFLGRHIFPSLVRLRNENLRRIIKKMQQKEADTK